LRSLFGRDQQFLGAATRNFARRIDARGHAVERFLRAHGHAVERHLGFVRAARGRIRIFGARLEREADRIQARFGFAGSLRDDLIWTSWIGTTVRAGHGNDALFGNSGDDQLFGETGDDILDGGSGNDLLAGGFGDDIYRVSTWSGNKTVIDSGGIDTLELNGVNNLSDLNLQRDGTDLLAGFTNARGSVTLKNFFNTDGEVNTTGAIDWLQFEDGQKFSASALANASGLAKAVQTSSSFTNVAFNP
jgi:Ca2+-binding RTX toxin-like protein